MTIFSIKILFMFDKRRIKWTLLFLQFKLTKIYSKIVIITNKTVARCYPLCLRRVYVCPCLSLLLSLLSRMYVSPCLPLLLSLSTAQTYVCPCRTLMTLDKENTSVRQGHPSIYWKKYSTFYTYVFLARKSIKIKINQYV